MKVQVCNLGAVKEGEVELKPLTVFIGPNNTGKTWTAYALAALLGPEGLSRYVKECGFDKFSTIYPTLHTAIQQALDEGNAKIDIIQFAGEYGEKYFNEIFLRGKHWMREIIGTKRASFENLEIKIQLGDTKSRFLEAIKASSLANELSVDRRTKNSLVSAFKEKGDSTLYFYTQAAVSDKLPPQVVRQFLIRNALQILHQALFSFIYTFPTERTSVATSIIRQVRTKRAKKAVSTAELDEEPRRTPSAVANFLSMTIEAYESTLGEREEVAKSKPQIKAYIELATLLETEILGGAVNFSTTEHENDRELFYQLTDNSSLEMTVVSSMVKELSSLVLYLRYIAEPGQWVIIDEPEMNLHPKAQVKLLELLTVLVNKGLQVLITTHSPYMVDHLSNLMKAATRSKEEKDKILGKFYLHRADAFISQKDVSVYLFNKGTTKNILQEEGVIDWYTFSRVSDQVSHIYFEI